MPSVGILSSTAVVAVSFVAIGARSAGGTTTLSVPHPAGTAANQILVAGRCTWTTTGECNPVDESGWTNSGALFGGTGTALDNHTSGIRADRQELAGASAGPTTFDQTGTGANGGGVGVMASYVKAAGTWNVATATGDDNTHASNRAVTASSAISFAPGDVLVAIAAFDTDTSLAITAQSMTATGITFGACSRRTPQAAGVTTGHDGNIELLDATVIAGSATIAPALSLTVGGSQCGPVVFVRLRAA